MTGRLLCNFPINVAYGLGINQDARLQRSQGKQQPQPVAAVEGGKVLVAIPQQAEQGNGVGGGYCRTTVGKNSVLLNREGGKKTDQVGQGQTLMPGLYMVAVG